MDPETVILENGDVVALIHYCPNGRIACMPGLQLKDMAAQIERQTPHIRAVAAAGVTCPMCKKTPLYKAAPNK